MDRGRARGSNGAEAGPKFTLDDVELDDPGAVFNLDLEYGDDDEDALLDWEQYEGLRKVRLCGREFSVPAWARPRPPDWWWAYTKRQRRLLLTGGCCCASFLVILLALVAAAAAGHSVLPGLIGKAEAEACAWTGLRLPAGVAPTRYALELDLQMEAPYWVNGSVTIYANVTRATNAATLRDRPAAEQLILEFRKALRPAAGVALTLDFGYQLAEGLSGLYRSSYAAPGNGTASVAVTQFEATSARAAFPCFDEPALKATFALSVRVADGYRETPPMSSYLLALVVGNFTGSTRSVPAGDAGAPARNVTVWGVPGREAELEFAVDVAARVLPALEAAFGNWGLITFRETALLAGKRTGTAGRRTVAQIVAHEMVHMWFGDLVTMAWWSELWLNEGFATYFEYLGAQAAVPAYHYYTTFYTDNVLDALADDALASSHPLSSPDATVQVSDAIEAQFDTISYQKGGALLRMLRAWVNRASKGGLTALERAPAVAPADDALLGALRGYLLRHARNASTAAELWTARWTYGRGFPLVRATVNERGALWLQQSLFGRGGVAACDPSEAFWVPVAMSRAANPDVHLWTDFSGCQSAHAVAQLAPDDRADWVKVNAGQVGLFRVQYDANLRARLLAAAPTPTLPALDLAGLLDDAWALAGAGQQNITHFLDLLAALARRPTAALEPWAAALPRLYEVRAMAPCDALWRRYLAGTLFASVLERGGANAKLFSFASAPAESDPVTLKLLRPQILEAAGYFGSAAVTTEALALVQASNGSLAVDPDAETALLKTAVHTGDRAVYDRVKDMYLAASEAHEKLHLLRAVSVSGPAAEETLDWALGPDVRAHDLGTVVGTVAAQSRDDGPDVAWRWLERRWGQAYAKLGSNTEASRKLGSIMENVASLFTNQTAIPAVQALFKAHQTKIRTSVYMDRAVEVIKSNADWVADHGEPLCAWVAQNAKLKP
ncbi:hypothetical protein QBZ16_000693 [Prototheca wickerhamii]|uniref:Aminopeptidase n=1 Tax=Prototheca wickerhamii TaxID=3111 RepID=A0AAD9ILM4_PROWI|nr:hypothetical protein QBZ16_000693 [Prototheca wickerhamii]